MHPLLVVVTQSDMEFGTYFTRTEVFDKDFTPKYSVNYVFFGHKTSCQRKKTIVVSLFSLISYYTLIIHMFPTILVD